MLRNNIIVIFWMAGLMLPSCIMPYEPHIETRNINKYVISGQVTDNSEYQTVSISMASPVGDPQFIPVSGCYARITDDKKNQFVMQEAADEAGVYKVQIDRSYLLPGISFKIDIITPDGVSIVSDFDRMPRCPEVDSVYYLRKDIFTDIPGEIAKGIQFYVDLDGGDINSHYFRWEVIETWEYHATYPMEWYYDGSVHHIYPPDYSRMVCWSTKLVKNIYTLSTENLTENKYEMLPLHFVDNRTPRLQYCYSLLINQIALSEGAYSYWDQMRINSTGQGGLYEKQPLAITGNLHNTTDPDQKVLGYFSASSVKSKRIFISNVENLELDVPTFCTPFMPKYGFKELSPSDYPTFLMGDKNGWWMVFLNMECVDCLTIGGTNIKPDFWPY
jgi:hypothetical protein